MRTTIAEMLGIITTSFDGPVALWWVSLALFAALCVAVGILIRRRMPLARASVALCVLIPLWAIAFSALGASFSVDRTSPTALADSAAPTRVLGALGVIALLSAGACIYRAKHQRLVATSIALFGGWFTFWVYFVAAMSVSGIWL